MQYTKIDSDANGSILSLYYTCNNVKLSERADLLCNNKTVS